MFSVRETWGLTDGRTDEDEDEDEEEEEDEEDEEEDPKTPRSDDGGRQVDDPMARRPKDLHDPTTEEPTIR